MRCNRSARLTALATTSMTTSPAPGSGSATSPQTRTSTSPGSFVGEIPLYAMLPREQLEGEILAITTANLRLFFSTLREGRPLAPEELAEIRMSAARRAEERVPLEAVLTAYHV